ncbi:hypothetical protein O5O45_00640 [Hahella aquimaris]|uniref:DUF6559 family protein n=1 Tax=Hahella sp. HNIBRBA332 TaxID=3015983 RepID=UPI00273CC207|nr:DUF6559 family protein [Hahella sp. HNIBRBA332]WLQ14442.1 hypothetical protein O5O45_00640 [Hahella sp. HNIBRBA332]
MFTRNWWRRRAAVKSYIKVLGPALAKKSGRKRVYPVKKVRALVKELGLSEQYIAYAIALYCKEADFVRYSNNHQTSVDQAVSYESARNFGMTMALSSIFWSGDSGHGASDGGFDSGGGGDSGL